MNWGYWTGWKNKLNKVVKFKTFTEQQKHLQFILSDGG